MKHNTYQIKLSGCTYIKRAFNEREAIILAQAEAIQAARGYEFESIIEFESR